MSTLDLRRWWLLTDGWRIRECVTFPFSIILFHYACLWLRFRPIQNRNPNLDGAELWSDASMWCIPCHDDNTDLLLSCLLLYRIHTARNARRDFRTSWACTDATLSSTVRERVLKVSTPPWLLPSSSSSSLPTKRQHSASRRAETLLKPWFMDTF